MSDRQFEHAVHGWLEDGSDRTPPAAIETVLFAVKTTPQERDLRIPWRFIQMPNYVRYAAAAAIVLVVGVGVLAINLRSPSAGTGGSPAPSLTAAPTATPAASLLPGITGLTTYHSAVYGTDFGYPTEWHKEAAAARKWQPGDSTSSDATWVFADIFASPDGVDQIGLWVWEMPAGSGADITSHAGLTAWAVANVCDAAIDACATVPDIAVPMCIAWDSCRPAVIVPLSDSTTAFLADTENGLVTIFSLGRPDSFPGAARYGGSVQLLKSILTTMDVFTPRPGQIPGG
jgi:hypothetical protein